MAFWPEGWDEEEEEEEEVQEEEDTNDLGMAERRGVRRGWSRKKKAGVRSAKEKEKREKEEI